MYNATCLWAPQRLATRLRVLQRASIQRNDLFVTFRIFALRLSTRLVSARCDAPLRNATQRFVCYFSRLNSPRRGTPRRGTPHRTSTQRFVCYNASPRGSASHRAPRLPAAHRASIQLNDLFVTSRRSKAQRSATLHAFRQRSSPQFNATN